MRDVLDEFPYLGQTLVHFPNARTTELGNIVYLDSAATNQRPKSVIESMDTFHKFYNANVHRGIHWMSDTATEAMENARTLVAKFINAPSTRNIIFTSGTTQSINMVAHGMDYTHVVFSEMEHHANIVPWHLNKVQPCVVSISAEGTLNYGSLEAQIIAATNASQNVLVSITHVSNVLGTINNVKRIVELARRWSAYVLIDGAQAVGHLSVDVQELDVDFYAFSAHKMYGPMGVGVLYGKEEHLQHMRPMLGGGEMISHVSLHETQFNDLPFKFEAGTPNVSGIIGLGAAIDFIQKVGLAEIQQHEQQLVQLCLKELKNINGITVLGPEERGSVVAFACEGIHAHDISQILDQQGIAVRSGHHCAEPLHEILKVNGSIRASFGIYNSEEDIEALILALHKAKSFFT